MKRVLLSWPLSLTALTVAGLAVGWLSGSAYHQRHHQIQGEADVQVLGGTEDGTKIYRFTHPKLIVPLVVVESRSGQVSIR